MAECDDIFRPMEVFWTKDDTFDDDNTAYIPGVMNPGNRRPQRSRPKVICKKTKEVKPKAQSTQLAIQKPSSKCSQKSNIKPAEVSPKLPGDKTTTAKATLKDLCSDDKKRVANLIKELARLGEAKETMSGQLESERQIFERRIQDLIDQQDRICKERENVKEQLAECQKLLARYQEYLEQCTESSLQTQHPLSTSKVTSDMCHSSLDDTVSAFSHNKPSTYELPDHRADSKHEIPDNHLFPVYIEPKMDTCLKPGPFMTLRSQVTKHNPPVRDPSLDDRLCSLKHDEDTSFTDRPFTKKIDKIIADEKRGDEVFDKRAMTPPLLSIVQTSRFSMNDGLDFQPLIQGDDHHLVSKPSIYHISNHKKGMQSPVATTMPSPLENSNRFVNYYKNLSPEERRNQLLAQKMALLEEQKRLKAILMEQEQMLHLKQDHLHRQQEIQQKRLKHFENTGTFPPHHQSKQPVEAYKAGRMMASVSSHMLNGGMTQQVDGELPNGLKKHHPRYDGKLLGGKDNIRYNNYMAAGPECHSTLLHEQQPSRKPVTSDQLESKEKNEHWFENQIANIHPRQQTEVTKKMMSRATSPIHLTYCDEAVSTEPATEEQMLAVDNPLSIQTSDLIDLVNEVDEGSILGPDGSIHIYTSHMRQSQSNSDKTYCDSDNCSYINDINSFDEEDPDKEESRVLEDVFFIK